MLLSYYILFVQAVLCAALPRLIIPRNPLTTTGGFYMDAPPRIPVYDNPLVMTNNTDCSNLMQNLTTACWNKMNMTGYIQDWWNANGTYCQQRNIGFAACYQMSLGIEQQACATIGPSQCSFPFNFAREGYTPQQAYVLFSIFAIWQWFDSIYMAVENADVSASGPVGAIVRLLNPIKNQHHILQDFLTALSAFAPCLAFPAGGAWGIFKVSTVLEAVVRQAPGVVKTMNPVGTLDSQFADMTNLASQLSVVKNTYQQNVSQALNMVQTNFTNFRVFSADGGFVAPVSDLQAQTVNMTLNLQTYIISQALQDSNAIITMARDTNPLEMTKNGSVTYQNIMDCSAYDVHGLCGEWWWDNSTNIAYAISNVGDPGRKYHSALKTIFDNGWTTPQLLFAGAKSCADYVAVTGGSNAPRLDTETFWPRCISNTQVCVYDQSCQMNDPGCLYTKEYGSYGKGGLCKPPKNYFLNGCPGNTEGTLITINIPAAYMGPMVHDDNSIHEYCAG